MAHLLSAFIPDPQNIRFETQQEEERIILLLRAHPITNILWIVMGTLLVLTPFIGYVLLPYLNIVDSPLGNRIFLIFSILIELIALGYIFEQFLNYYYSVYIVTNLRVVDIDFVNLLRKTLSDAQMQDVEDATLTQSGIFSSIFNYGNVVIQTAGAKPSIDFYAVPRPNEVVQIIGELQMVNGGND